MNDRQREKLDEEDRQQHLRSARLACRHCDGVGYVTIWLLITYAGQSMTVKRKEVLPNIHNERQACSFQRKMLENPGTENQIVVSAARRCVCLAPAREEA